MTLFSTTELVGEVGVLPRGADPRVAARAAVVEREVEASREAGVNQEVAVEDRHDRDRRCEQNNSSRTWNRLEYPLPPLVLVLNGVECLMLPLRLLRTMPMTTDSNLYNSPGLVSCL